MVPDIHTRDAVLDAYREAKAAGKEPPLCYKAAVDAWCELHPEHNHTRAATQAVKIVYESFGTLLDMARE